MATSTDKPLSLQIGLECRPTARDAYLRILPIFVKEGGPVIEQIASQFGMSVDELKAEVESGGPEFVPAIFLAAAMVGSRCVDGGKWR